MCLLEAYDLLSENYKVVHMKMLDQAKYFAMLNQNEKAQEVYEDTKNQILGISEEVVNKTRYDMYKRHSKKHGLRFPE